MRAVLFSLVVMLLCLGGTVRGQTVITNRLAFPQPGAQVVRPFAPGGAGANPGTNSPFVRPAPPVRPAQPRPNPTAPDAFDNMIASAASFDMDSAVSAVPEFDPPVVPAGGRVLYRITVNALEESLEAPERLTNSSGSILRLGGRGQTYLPGPNMRMRPQTTLLYHGTAANTGTSTIPAFNLMVYGQPVPVKETVLQVAPAGSTAGREPPRLWLELPPGDIYVGQTVKVLLILPTDNVAFGISQPHVSGDFIFAEPINLGQRQEEIQRNGRSFHAILQEVSITPLRDGPQEILAQAHSPVGRPLPGQAGGMVLVTTLVDSDRITLNALPLPKEGQLPGFTGAVGTFSFELPRLNSPKTYAGEPVTMSINLRGSGSIGRLTPPPFPALREWQGFPAVPDSTPSFAVQQRGFASFSYTMIPLSETIKFTPAIPFSYFDPSKKAYISLPVPKVPISVLPAATGGDGWAKASTNGAETAITPESETVLSMTGLMESPGRAAEGLTPLQQRPWFLAFQFVPTLALAGLWGWDRRRRFLEAHPEVVLKRRARRGLRRQLRLARQSAAAADAGGFAMNAAGALREASAPHEAANPAALVGADVLRQLPGKSGDAPGAVLVRRRFAAADAARYGGATGKNLDLAASKDDFEKVAGELKSRL